MSQPGAVHPEVLNDLTFSGGSGTECENFIRFVKRKAFAEQKSRDNEWMAFFASTCLTGQALRWFEALDDDVQYNWKLLSKALLDRYPATYVEPTTPQRSGTPLAAATDSRAGWGPPPPPQQTSILSPGRPMPPLPPNASRDAGPAPGWGPPQPGWGPPPPLRELSQPPPPNGAMPGSWAAFSAAAAPPPPPSKQPSFSMTIPAAPPPQSAAREVDSQPKRAQPAGPRTTNPFSKSLLNSFLRLNLSGPQRGRIFVRCDDASESGYVARKITDKSAGPLYGFHVVTKSPAEALQVEFTPPSGKQSDIKPYVFKMLNSSEKGFEFLGATWYERQPNYLGKGPGHTAYSHLTGVAGKESHELTSSYVNNDDGSYGDHDSDFDIVGKEIWKVSEDGVISAWWSDYGGKSHQLEIAVCLHDKEVYFVSDYSEFAKLYGPTSYTRAKLAFEQL